ncbi:MAG: ATP-binding cassette domain-containing protein, partial [Rikenellaceae bacterium]
TSSKYSSDNIRHITFRDSYGSADGAYYYQQRWNASERDEAPTVAELLSKVKSDEEFRAKLFSMLKIDDMLDKSIILLSSGELRKFQMAKMLLDKPRVVVVESPYIGLDVAAREVLNELFESLTKQGDVQIIISVCASKDIPNFITHVYKVENMICSAKMYRDEFVSLSLGVEREPYSVELPATCAGEYDFEQVVQFNNLGISYGTKTVLEGINWTINKGERWSLMGPNGSGKSTLLSLIAADNPMAYAKDITLFGRKRGTGESIWDIKKRIGYLCPEMHRSYVVDIAAVDIVASGFVDSIGLYFTPSEQQRQQCLEWMRVCGVEHLSSRSFVKLSSGEQRLLLLLRAFVKDPELLILDEPLHGLDEVNKLRARTIIEAFCARKDKTMIYVTHYKGEMPSCVTLHKSLRDNYSLED